MKKIPLFLVMLLLGMALSAQSEAPAPDYRIGSWAVAFWVWDFSIGNMQASGRSWLDDLSGKVTGKQYPSLPAFLTDLDVKGWAVDKIATLMSGQGGLPTLAITLKRK